MAEGKAPGLISEHMRAGRTCPSTGPQRDQVHTLRVE